MVSTNASTWSRTRWRGGNGVKRPEGRDWLEGQGMAISMPGAVPPTEHRSEARLGLYEDGYYHLAIGTGEFGGMGREGAVKLGYRGELAAVEDPVKRKELFDEMVERMYRPGKAVSTASHFEIDDVIDPMESRRWIMSALRSAPPVAPRTGKKRPCIDSWKAASISKRGASRKDDDETPASGSYASNKLAVNGSEPRSRDGVSGMLNKDGVQSPEERLADSTHVQRRCIAAGRSSAKFRASRLCCDRQRGDLRPRSSKDSSMHSMLEM